MVAADGDAVSDSGQPQRLSYEEARGSAAAADGSAPGKVSVQRVNNVTGSTAGAGSSTFHIYRHLRREEEERLAKMDASAADVAERAAFDEKLAKNEAEAEERTKKRRRQRERRSKSSKGKSGARAAAAASASASAAARSASEESAKEEEEEEEEQQQQQRKEEVFERRVRHRVDVHQSEEASKLEQGVTDAAAETEEQQQQQQESAPRVVRGSVTIVDEDL